MHLQGNRSRKYQWRTSRQPSILMIPWKVTCDIRNYRKNIALPLKSQRERILFLTANIILNLIGLKSHRNRITENNTEICLQLRHSHHVNAVVNINVHPLHDQCRRHLPQPRQYHLRGYSLRLSLPLQTGLIDENIKSSAELDKFEMRPWMQLTKAIKTNDCSWW